MKSEDKDSKFSSKLKRMVKKIPIISPNRDRSNNEGDKVTQPKEEFPKFDPKALDRKPFRDCDNLYRDCEDFLKISGKTIQFTKKYASDKPTLVPLKINKWRAKRKGNSLYQMYESLHQRIELAEERLKDVTNHSVHSASSFVTQALYINARLKACIVYNSGEVERAKPLLDQGSAFLADLKAMESSLEAMLRMYDALTDMKHNQHEPYIPWALRIAAQNNQTSVGGKKAGGNSKAEDVQQPAASTSAPLEPLLDRKMILKRLKKVRKVRYVSAL